MKMRQGWNVLMLVCLSALRPLGAQVFRDPYVMPMGQWTAQGRLFVCPDEPLRWLSQGRVREVKHPSLPNPLGGQAGGGVPTNLGRVGFHLQDSLWINGWTRKESILFRYTATGWEEAAKVPCTSFARMATLVPLRNGRFLVFNPPDPEPKPKKRNPYFYGIFAQDDRGALVARTLEPLPEKNWQEDLNLANATLLDAAAVTEDHLTVGCAEYGRFWIFSLEDGRLKHTVDLYGKETAKLLGHKEIPRMVLEFQACKDHRLLICARDEAVIKPLVEEIQKAEARLQGWMRPNMDREQEDAQWQSLQRQVVEALLPFPQLAWFELDPEKGTVKRLGQSPVGAQDILPIGKEAPFWLVDEEGRVVYTDKGFTAFAQTPEEQPKVAPKAPKADKP